MIRARVVLLLAIVAVALPAFPAEPPRANELLKEAMDLEQRISELQAPIDREQRVLVLLHRAAVGLRKSGGRADAELAEARTLADAANAETLQALATAEGIVKSGGEDGVAKATALEREAIAPLRRAAVLDLTRQQMIANRLAAIVKTLTGDVAEGLRRVGEAEP